MLFGIFLEILLDQGYFFSSLSVFEEEDLFFLSLYFISLRRLHKRSEKVNLYINSKQTLIKETDGLNVYLGNDIFSNPLLLKHLSIDKVNNFFSLHVHLSSNIDKEEISSKIRFNMRGWGSVEDEMIGLNNAFSNLSKYPVLSPIHSDKFNIPFLVLGSGPSLELNMEWLKKHSLDFIIISCGTALKILEKHNIKPDFHVEIERTTYLAKLLSQSDLSDTTIVCAHVVNKEVLELGSKDSLIFIRGGTGLSFTKEYFKNSLSAPFQLPFAGPLVGNAGFALASLFSSRVFFLGLDCAFIEGYSKHAKGSLYGDEERVNLEQLIQEADLLKVRGNYFPVYASSLFLLSRNNLEEAIKFYRVEAFNLGMGAYIKGSTIAKETKLKEIRQESRDKVKEKLREAFQANSNIKINFNDLISDFNLENFMRLLKGRVDSKVDVFRRINLAVSFIFQHSLRRASGRGGGKQPFLG